MENRTRLQSSCAFHEDTVRATDAITRSPEKNAQSLFGAIPYSEPTKALMTRSVSRRARIFRIFSMRHWQSFVGPLLYRYRLVIFVVFFCFALIPCILIYS